MEPPTAVSAARTWWIVAERLPKWLREVPRTGRSRLLVRLPPLPGGLALGGRVRGRPREVIPAPLARPARGAFIALVLALMMAAPAAAAQPTRSVHPLSGGFTLPAGTACPFDVAGEPSTVSVRNGFSAKTVFSNGTVLRFVRAKGRT